MWRLIRLAGCLIIGDEVLNGKIHDTNSFEFAKTCFSQLSVPVKRIIVCSDDKADIKKLLKLLRDDDIDFIVTSGGLGSTHDDVTYDAIAEYYGIPCERDPTVVKRMNRLRKDYIALLTPSQTEAWYRMATVPQRTAKINVENIFVDPNFWFPIVAIEQQLYILPGVPQLFVKLLKALVPQLLPRVDQLNQLSRLYVKTTTGESELAPFLGDLQRQLDEQYGDGVVKIGSYPHLQWRVNTISIIGIIPQISVEDLQHVVDDVLAGVGGDAVQISQAEEDHLTNDSPSNF